MLRAGSRQLKIESGKTETRKRITQRRRVNRDSQRRREDKDGYLHRGPERHRGTERRGEVRRNVIK
jgi:hypothetical protein